MAERLMYSMFLKAAKLIRHGVTRLAGKGIGAESLLLEAGFDVDRMGTE